MQLSLRHRIAAAAAVLAVVAAACTAGGEPAAEPAPVATPGDPPAAAPSPTDGESPEPTPPSRSYAGVDPAPEFPEGLDWLNTDRPLSLSELQGKVVLLDFWTYGCINCIHIIPDLERLESEFADELVVIGVHSAKFTQEGGTENIRNVILRYGLEHPVVNDRDFEVWRTWGARAWPTIALIDPAGNIVGAHEGEGVYPVVQPVVLSLVQEFAARGELDTEPLNVTLERAGRARTVLSFPGKVHADPGRDRLFVSDSNHHRVVEVRISDGDVLAVYGSGRPGFADGDAAAAHFRQPQGLGLGAGGDKLYVADLGNHAVREIDLGSGRVTTVAGTGRQGRYPPTGGFGPETALHSPWDLTVAGDTLYVAMAGSHQIWTIDLATLEAVPFAGNGRESTRNGPRVDAELAQPSGVALGQGRLYFADSESSSIRFVDMATQEVDLLVGADSGLFDFGDQDGVGAEARLQHPLGVSWHDGALYVADTYNSSIRVVDPATMEITTLFGGEAGWRDGTDPLFYEPGGLHVARGVAYVADTNNHVVRTIDLATGAANTIVLKGIERFMPAPDAEDYQGTVLALPPTEVAAGPATVVLDVVLPPGHKVNDQAPSTVVWTVDGGVAEFPGGDTQSLTGTELPALLDVTFGTGTGTINGDITLIWCADEAESLCFIEELKVTAPVTVGASGASELRFSHEVAAPGL